MYEKLNLLQCRICLRLIGISRDEGMVADLIVGGRHYDNGYYKHCTHHVEKFEEDVIHWKSRSIWLS